MNKKDVRLAKRKILKCLTEDFEYGNKKGRKKHRQNQAIFNKKEGFQNFNNTDLEMIMDKVMLGLYFAMEDSKEIKLCPNCNSENIEIFLYNCQDCAKDFIVPKTK